MERDMITRMQRDILDRVVHQKRLFLWIFFPSLVLLTIILVLLGEQRFGFGTEAFWWVVIPVPLIFTVFGIVLFRTLDRVQGIIETKGGK